MKSSALATSLKKTTHNSTREDVFLHSVEVPLTETERLIYADELTQLDTEQRTLDATLAGAKAHHKAETERVADRQGVVLDRLRTKKEFKDIECRNDFNFTDGICQVRRIDTDEVVMTRRMEADEYKENLPFEKDIDAHRGEIIGADE